MADLDLELIRHALEVARANGISEVEIELGDASFEARLGALPAVVSLATNESEAPPETVDANVKTLTAPLVGYFRPGKAPLKVGDRVEKGSIVAVVAALGLANDVEAPYGGEILEIFVEPEQPVEFGQPLARVRVDS